MSSDCRALAVLARQPLPAGYTVPVPAPVPAPTPALEGLERLVAALCAAKVYRARWARMLHRFVTAAGPLDGGGVLPAHRETPLFAKAARAAYVRLRWLHWRVEAAVGGLASAATATAAECIAAIVAECAGSGEHVTPATAWNMHAAWVRMRSWPVIFRARSLSVDSFAADGRFGAALSDYEQAFALSTVRAHLMLAPTPAQTAVAAVFDYHGA